MVLLDVDGVLLPMPHEKVTPADDLADYPLAIPPFLHQQLHIRPVVIAAINEWVEAGADVQWFSSWGRRTRFFDHLGLPRLPVSYDPAQAEVLDWGRSQRQWNRPAVERYLAELVAPIRLAWLDDDAFFWRASELQKEMLAAQTNLSEFTRLWVWVTP